MKGCTIHAYTQVHITGTFSSTLVRIQGTNSDPQGLLLFEVQYAGPGTQFCILHLLYLSSISRQVKKKEQVVTTNFVAGEIFVQFLVLNLACVVIRWCCTQKLKCIPFVHVVDNNYLIIGERVLLCLVLRRDAIQEFDARLLWMTLLLCWMAKVGEQKRQNGLPLLLVTVALILGLPQMDATCIRLQCDPSTDSSANSIVGPCCFRTTTTTTTTTQVLF